MQAQFVSVQEVRALYYSALVETSVEAYTAFLKAVSEHDGRSVKFVGNNVGGAGVQGHCSGCPYYGGGCAGAVDSTLFFEGCPVAVHVDHERGGSYESGTFRGGTGGDVGGGTAVERVAVGGPVDTRGRVRSHGSFESESYDSNSGGAASVGAVHEVVTVDGDVPGPNVVRNRIWRKERKEARRKARVLSSGASSPFACYRSDLDSLGEESVEEMKVDGVSEATLGSDYCKVDPVVVNGSFDSALVDGPVVRDFAGSVVFGDFVPESLGAATSVVGRGGGSS